MWQYNYDYLCHSSHKYLDKYMGRNGKWVYVYEDAKELVGNRVNSIKTRINRNKFVRKSKADAANSKIGSLLDQQMKSTLDPNRRNAQSSREAAIQAAAKRIQERNRKNQLEKAARQAEREHSGKSDFIDSVNNREREINKSVQTVRRQKAARQAEKEHSRKALAYTAQKSRNEEISKSSILHRYDEYKKRQKKAAKQAEQEHASKTTLIDNKVRRKVVTNIPGVTVSTLDKYKGRAQIKKNMPKPTKRNK